ncbi:hypothetical protein C3747_95g73 [Trypanosoma cruzi]|uniref:Uncharacterized protein n=2 Tax=Trypanosoma cruzi TaxID=5693 RepID=Q4DPG3_TRYCC|nr:hypothetical protein, conserved [Trypanosoma cruzi]EAN94407.1 hypothetical protein, conserved [Trypanosoma cruzi]PWV08022.1 hypothetical protein C3747_95g73 [Trypanosoma cruzi]|eukprot:XP_816258.1 hypothetical protein [Trypanosoma cruzi strain CL Brener]
MEREVANSKGKVKNGSRGRKKDRSRRKSRSASRRRSRSASRSRSRSASMSRSRSASRRSRSASRRRSRSASRRRSRSASRRRSRSLSSRGRSTEKSGGNSAAELRRNLDKSADKFPLRLLVEGESCLIDPHISEMEITLYRAVPEEGNLPLFFDTTACLFSDHGGQTDYVGVGRETTNNKGLSHIPHAVLKFEADSVGSRNFLEPAGGPSVIAGDGVSVNLKRLVMWGGFSLCATLFTKNTSLTEVTDAYYAVKVPKAQIPLAVVPVTPTSSHNSCIALMVRKMKGNTKAVWELVRIGELCAQQDVKGVLVALQNRGLVCPADYRLLSYQGLDYSSEGCDEESFAFDDDDEDDDEGDNAVDNSIVDENARFENLLANVPRVAREGRRQYSVGRSILNTVLDTADGSDDDEVMRDALRAVVPRYTSLRPVRYEDKTYNVGSRDEVLASHYVSHREEYGLHNAESQSGKGFYLPPIFSPSSGKLSRLSFGRTGFVRPSAPNELLATIPSALSRRSGTGRRGGRSSVGLPKLSVLRGRSKSRRGRKGKKKGRRSRSKKSRSRRSGSKRRKRLGSRVRSSSSSRRSSRRGNFKKSSAAVDPQNGNGEEE